MQYNLSINQKQAVEWELNIQQATLFAFLYELPSWAESILIGGTLYFFASQKKMMEELPLLLSTKDTAYRIAKVLEDKGLIGKTIINNRTYFCITDKGKAWNRKQGGRVGKKSDPPENIPTSDDLCEVSEKIPTPEENNGPSEKNPTLGKNTGEGSEKNPGGVGKNPDPGSEKNPTDNRYQDHRYQDHTDQDHNHRSGSVRERPPSSVVDWWPSEEVVETLIKFHRIPETFIDEEVAEFRIYWADRGEERTSWNSKFLTRVREQWARKAHQWLADPVNRELAEISAEAHPL